MARKAGGTDQLAAARELLRTAKTADELRTAQAVLLPLELGLSLKQTARAIGRSVGATCNLRTRYCKVARHEREAPRPKRALRNRAHATLEREAQILDAVLADALRGGVVVVPPLKENVEQRLGKPVALSTIYRMLARNGWRKLAPDTAHPQGDAVAREDWKKTPGDAGPNRRDLEQRTTATADVSGRGTVRAHLRHPLLLVPPPGPTARKRHGDAPYTYTYGAVSPQDGCFDSLMLPHVNSECMQLFLDEIARRYPNDNGVMVLDGAGWHKSKDFRLPNNLRLLFLPPYSPELNPQEHLWDALREKHFHNRVFDSIDALEDHLVAALRDLEHSPDRVKSIAGWDWIINAVSSAK